MVYFFVFMQPMRLSPTGTVRGRLRFCDPQGSSIRISKPTMGKIDILQFCHRRFNNSFFFVLRFRTHMMFFVQTWSLYHP